MIWDETKRRSNIADHGLDFVGCEAIWDNFTITREDIRQTYAENAWSHSGYLKLRRWCWCTPNAGEARTSSLYANGKT